MKISACLVLYNEEKTISRCLESISGAVDEIIVVHDGPCNDRTLSIVRGFTDKIFIREHMGVAEPHRPFTFEQATGDWILQIDGDEFLSDELRRELRILSACEDVDAYEFLWKLWDGKKYLTESWPHKRCLFRKKKLSYLGIPNFVAEIDGFIEKSELTLEHRPEYNNYNRDSLTNKWFRWARLQAWMYLQDFSVIAKFNYQADGWPAKVKLRVRCPLLLIPAEFIITFLKSLVAGALREGGVGYKVAFMLGIYRAMVNYYIFKQK